MIKLIKYRNRLLSVYFAEKEQTKRSNSERKTENSITKKNKNSR